MPAPDQKRLRELVQRLPEGGEQIARSNQGIVHRIRCGGRELAIKSAAGRGPAAAVNRWTLRREHAAYGRLAGVAGIPRCHGLIDRRWLVLEFVAGRPFRDANPANEYFDRLLATIQAMHARGVAHGDLKRKANLLVTPDDAPVMLDFGAAVLRRQGFHPVNRRLFEFMRRTDLNAWVKLKYGGYNDIAETDRSLLRRSALERVLEHLRG